MTRITLLEANGIGVAFTGVLARDAIERHGGFRLELSVGEDTEFAARIADHCRVVATDRCLVKYRTHENQGHRNLAAFEHDALWILTDRYGAPNQRALYLRGIANLYTRLFCYRLLRRDVGGAVSALSRVVSSRPDRLVRLPMEALIRRCRRRWRKRHYLGYLLAASALAVAATN